MGSIAPPKKRQGYPVNLSTRFFFKTLLAVLLAAAFAFAQDTFEGVKRIVAVGDVHGAYDKLIDILHNARLIDEKNKWIGGKTHLVLVGDLIDRGPASTKVMDLIMELEPKAASAGGRVHALLGNHEAMNIYGDLRYLSKEDYQSYQRPDSENLRDRELDLILKDLKDKGKSPPDEPAFRKEFKAEHPLGWIEQRLAFGPEGKYGKWLRQKKVIIKINDLLFVHGGISSKYASITRKQINETIRAELEDLTKIPNGMTVDPDGPLWYRGWAELPDNDLDAAAQIDEVLKLHQANHIVIGHTPADAIMPRFGGKVIEIDVGLALSAGAPEAFLLVENSKYYAVHQGQRLELPLEGRGLLPYLEAIKTAHRSSLLPVVRPAKPVYEISPSSCW